MFFISLIERHFQQYFSYNIVAVGFTGEGNQSTGKNHWPVASHSQTLSYNVVSSTPRHDGIQTHNCIGHKHWLHM
jgi:hypothetical protein